MSSNVPVCTYVRMYVCMCVCVMKGSWWRWWYDQKKRAVCVFFWRGTHTHAHTDAELLRLRHGHETFAAVGLINNNVFISKSSGSSSSTNDASSGDARWSPWYRTEWLHGERERKRERGVSDGQASDCIEWGLTWAHGLSHQVYRHGLIELYSESFLFLLFLLR